MSKTQVIRQMLQEGHSLSQVARATGRRKSTISYHAQKLGLGRGKRIPLKKYDWKEVQRVYDKLGNGRETMRRFGINRASWWKARKRGDIVTRGSILIPLENMLIEHSPYGRSHIKMRLSSAGLLKDRCYVCGVNGWMGKPLSLQLDHINGVCDNYRIENIRLLCPNCHSQTETYAGKRRRARDSTAS